MKRWSKLPVFLVAAALVGLALAPVATAAREGSDRPFKAMLTGAATYVVPAGCPPDCTAFTTNTDATGQATHLGQVAVHMSHRPYDLGNQQDGSMTMIAANGDTLYGVYDYDLFSEGPISVALTGGTGRFANASGTIFVAADVIPQIKPIPPCDPDTDPFGCLDPDVPWPWTATLSGTITY